MDCDSEHSEHSDQSDLSDYESASSNSPHVEVTGLFHNFLLAALKKEDVSELQETYDFQEIRRLVTENARFCVAIDGASILCESVEELFEKTLQHCREHNGHDAIVFRHLIPAVLTVISRHSRFERQANDIADVFSGFKI